MNPGYTTERSALHLQWVAVSLLSVCSGFFFVQINWRIGFLLLFCVRTMCVNGRSGHMVGHLSTGINPGDNVSYQNLHTHVFPLFSFSLCLPHHSQPAGLQSKPGRAGMDLLPTARGECVPTPPSPPSHCILSERFHPGVGSTGPKKTPDSGPVTHEIGIFKLLQLCRCVRLTR